MERYNPYAAGHVESVGETLDGRKVWAVVVEDAAQVFQYFRTHDYRNGRYLCKDGGLRKGWVYYIPDRSREQDK